jgi:hypothetical protein
MHRQHSCHRGDVGGRGAECLLDSCSDPWYPPHELSGDLLEAMQRGFDAIAPAIAQYTWPATGQALESRRLAIAARVAHCKVSVVEPPDCLAAAELVVVVRGDQLVAATDEFVQR